MYAKIKNTIFNNKDFLYFITISIAGSAFSSFSPLVVAKLLNPTGFGSYSLGMTMVFLFFSIFISTSQAPCIVLSNREFKTSGKANHSFSVLIGITVTTIIITAIIFFALDKNIAEFTCSSAPFLSMSILLAFIGYSLKSFSQTALLGFDKKKSSAILEAIFGLFSFTTLIILFLLHITFLPLIIFVYFPAGVLSLIVCFYIINYNHVLPVKFHKETFNEIIHFTKWQVLGLSAGYLVNWGDNIVLRIYVQTDQIGIYGLAYKLFGGMMTIIFFVNTYFLPFLSKRTDDSSAIRDYLYTKRPKIFVIILGGIVLGLLIIPILIKFLYAEEFTEAIPIFLILSIAMCFMAYYVFYLPLFNSLGRYKIIQIGAVIQIIINMGLDFALVPSLGIYGAAIATVAGYAAITLLLEIYFRKFINYRKIILPTGDKVL